MIHDIPYPRLLNASGGTERFINPIDVSISLKMVPLSSASIRIAEDETIPERSYVELYTCVGSAGIFRVRSPKDTYGGYSGSAELEHAIVEVGDYLVKGKYDEMMAASTAMKTVFSHYKGSKWKLGSVSALGNRNIALQTNYDSVLSSMLTILNQVDDCMLSFDFKTTPWTVSVVKKGTTVAAEGRIGRNVYSATITYDDTELCNKAYYEYQYEDGNGETQTEWRSVQDNTSIKRYGLVEREVQTGSDYTEAEALRVANAYLNSHKEPRISIEIDGIELSELTGEPLDSFEIGKLFGLALPDYNTTVEKNITSLTFPNVYSKPESVNVLLDKDEDTVINFLHDIDKTGSTSSSRGGGGGRGKQKDDEIKEFRTRFDMDDYHIGLISEHADKANTILQAAGLDINSQTGVIIYHDDIENGVAARLTVNANAITQEAYRASLAEGLLGGRITVEADRITQEVNRASIAEGLLSGRITVEADRITQEVTRATTAEGTLSGRITVEAGKISQIVSAVGSDGQVTAASICLAINNGGSSATINADKIYLLGQTIANQITADYIDSKIANLSTLHGISASFSGNVSATGAVSGSGLYIGSGTSFQSVAEGIKLVQVVPDGNNYKLQYQKFNSDGWVDASTFSRATSLSGGWSGGTFRVNASPQGASISTQIVQGTATWNGNSATVPIEAIDSDNPGYQYATGRSVLVDATARYNAGYSYGKDDYKPDNIRISGQSIYVLNADGDDVGGPYSCSAIYNSGYDAGWNAARNWMIDNQYTSSYYTGTVATMYDAPTGGATARQVIYPYSSVTITRYYVPDAR